MIYKKLLEIQKLNMWVTKDWSNPHFKSSYMTLDNIVDTYSKVLNEKNILCLHQTKEHKLITTLKDLDDDTFIESEFEILNSDPQKRGAEITYWKRYNLGCLLNTITEDNDDWHKASWENFLQKGWFNDKELKELDNLVATMSKEEMKKHIWELKKEYNFSKEMQWKVIDLLNKMK